MIAGILYLCQGCYLVLASVVGKSLPFLDLWLFTAVCIFALMKFVIRLVMVQFTVCCECFVGLPFRACGGWSFLCCGFSFDMQLFVLYLRGWILLFRDLLLVCGV